MGTGGRTAGKAKAKGKTIGASIWCADYKWLRKAARATAALSLWTGPQAQKRPQNQSLCTQSEVRSPRWLPKKAMRKRKRPASKAKKIYMLTKSGGKRSMLRKKTKRRLATYFDKTWRRRRSRRYRDRRRRQRGSMCHLRQCRSREHSAVAPVSSACELEQQRNHLADSNTDPAVSPRHSPHRNK